jgi:hypothetical protein
VVFWLRLDPWLVVTALALSPLALALRNTRVVALAFLIQVAMIARPGYLPGMYVIALLPFAALIVAGTAQAFWRFAVDRRGGALVRRVAVTVAAVTLAAAAAGAGLLVAPRWARADHAAMTVPQDGPQRAAERWLVRNVRHDQRLIVTDDFWIYLIEHGFDSRPVKGGFNSRTVVSYWPLDKDPAVRRYFPNGWREFDYIVSTGAMRVTAVYTPSTQRALEHSHVVARFGRGGERIEVRRIDPP